MIEWKRKSGAIPFLNPDAYNRIEDGEGLVQGIPNSFHKFKGESR